MAELKELADERAELGQEPISAPLTTKSPEDLWKERLREVWNMVAAVSNAEGDEREAFVEEVVSAIDPDGLVTGTAAIVQPVFQRGGRGGEPIFRGTVTESHLWVRAGLDQVTTAEQLLAFVRGPVSQIIADLEGRDEGSFEQRTDIMIDALEPLRGLETSEEVALRLAAYLLRQEDPEEGVFISLGNLAGLATTSPASDADEIASTLNHIILAGLSTRAATGTADPPIDGVRRLVATAASNVAASAGGAILAVSAEISDEAVEVLRTLKRISGTFVPLLDDPEGIAGDVLSLAGVPMSAGRELEQLTVLSDMGVISNAWGHDPLELARLNAISALAGALELAFEQSPARFFNAGVALARWEGSGEAPMAAELAMDLLGLTWAAQTSTTLTAFIEENDGLDCAVNFAGTAAQLLAAGFRDKVGPEVEEVLRLLGGLTAPGALSISTDAMIIGLQRLRGSLARFELETLTTPPPLVELAQAGTRAVVTLRGLEPEAAVTPDRWALLRLAARVVGDVYQELDELSEGETFEETILDPLAEMLERRPDPWSALADWYAPFRDAGGPWGIAPTVVAGAMEPARYDQLIAGIQKPPESAVEALRILPS